MTNVVYAPKMIIVDIQKRLVVLFHTRRLMEIAFNEFCDDFDRSYIDIILFLRVLKSHDYKTHS